METEPFRVTDPIQETLPEETVFFPLLAPRGPAAESWGEGDDALPAAALRRAAVWLTAGDAKQFYSVFFRFA